MTRRAGAAAAWTLLTMLLSVLAWASAGNAEEPVEHPLEPPDRSSPHATMNTFLGSIDRAWELYQDRDPAVRDVFARARGCLDLSGTPPLVVSEVSAETALVLKDVLDRIELPPPPAIPDAADVALTGIARWTVPHTEITLHRVAEGPRAGEWLFSPETVARAAEFLERVSHLPYQPGRAGGHVAELRSASRAVLLLKLVESMPPAFKSQLGPMPVWQWFGLVVFVTVLALGIAGIAWVARRWRAADLPGRRLGDFLVTQALTVLPVVGGLMLRRLFVLPGGPAVTLELVFTVIGVLGSMWLVWLAGARLGDFAAGLGSSGARPLKRQLVRAVFRVATIVFVTGITVKALYTFGVPVAGLVAGLGVGGLAIALAAQSTLENFIGGIILYADQPVKVGDFCRFGDGRGLVEDVGPRSTRIRTLDRTVVTIPNATFAKMELENLSGRDRILLREKIRLRYETTREQLQGVMSALEAMLREHPRISDDRLRVRFNGLAEASLEIELYAYAETGDWPEFTRIREEVLLEVLEIVERSDTRLAVPTEVHYVRGQHEAQPGT